MKAGGHTMAEMHAGDRGCFKVPGIQDKQIAAVPGPVSSFLRWQLRKAVLWPLSEVLLIDRTSCQGEPARRGASRLP